MASKVTRRSWTTVIEIPPSRVAFRHLRGWLRLCYYRPVKLWEPPKSNRSWIREYVDSRASCTSILRCRWSTWVSSRRGIRVGDARNRDRREFRRLDVCLSTGNFRCSLAEKLFSCRGYFLRVLSGVYHDIPRYV